MFINQEEIESRIIRDILNKSKNHRIKNRESSYLEFKESFAKNTKKYLKTIASFANTKGGIILFGVKDSPRDIIGVNENFDNFSQEQFTENLNSYFSPEIEWISGVLTYDGDRLGYIYIEESEDKPVIALKNESDEKINTGDIYYRYNARSEKIRYPEMKRIIEENKKKEQERILKLIETIKNSETTNLGIINYNNGKISTPYGVDVSIDKKIIVKVLKKAKYIKSGEFSEEKGAPVIKVTGNLDLAEEVEVPDLDPNVQYPYLRKALSEKLEIGTYETDVLIWKYKLKENKKFHTGIDATSNGGHQIHKYSEFAVRFLADKINCNKGNSNWLDELKIEYRNRNKLKE